MKKKLIAFIAFLCVGVLLTTTILTLGVQNTAGSHDADKTASASALADEITSTMIAPSNDMALPKDCEIWDGALAGDFAGGTGTRSDPYLISTPAQFALMVYKCAQYSVNSDNKLYYTCHYKITNDLVFNEDFDIIGNQVAPDDVGRLHPLQAATSTSEFTGSIDGGGHKLFNLYIPFKSSCTGTGLFGELKGTIIDTHLVRGYMSSKENNDLPGSGAFARMFSGTLDGCSSGMTIIYTGTGGSVGGLVGVMHDKSVTSTATLKNCTFTGRVTMVSPDHNKGYATGGILGAYDGGTENGSKVMTITDCVNRGIVESNSKFIGGIVGRAGSTSTAIKAERFAVARCLNFGTVRSTYIVHMGLSSAENVYVGGIIGGAGYMSEKVTTSYHMENCGNFGTVSAMENKVGGLIGSMWFQSDVYTNPLRLYACYSLGEVKSEGPNGETMHIGGENIGGIIGDSVCPIEIYDSVIGGTVSGNKNVGGVIGRVYSDAKHSENSGLSKVTISASHITSAVTGTTCVGGVVGEYKCGGSAENTVFRMVGTFVEGSSIGSNLVGGLVGCLSTGKGNKRLLSMNFDNSISNMYVETSLLNAQRGILIGGSMTSATPTLKETEFYAASNVYDSSSGTPVRVTSALPMHNTRFLTLANLFTEQNLTGGSYLLRLEFGAAKMSSTIKWVSSAEDGKPIHRNVNLIRTALPLTREYNGMAITLSHDDWLKNTPVCAWEKWDGTEWVSVGEAPRSVGKYRVKAALLNAYVSGAAVLEFEIVKRVVDFNALEWDEETSLTYTGLEHTMELAGVPAGITTTYVDSRKTNAGIYYARLIDAVDESGNYEIINLDLAKAKERRWEIKKANLNMENVVWSDIDMLTARPLLVYNEKPQSIRLIDKTDPERDLSALLHIVYSGETHTEAGNYSATAKVTVDEDNVNITSEGTDFFTYWSIARREIRPWQEATFTGGTVTDGEMSGVTVVFDAREHALGYGNNLPSCVTVNVQHLTPDGDGEDDGKYVCAGQYEYEVTFTLSDTANNYFAVSSGDGFVETPETTLIESRYLVIEKATPKIYGAISQDTTYITWDPERIFINEDGSFTADAPHTFAIGIKYNQDKTIFYDENGQEVSTLAVDMDGIAALREELARNSLPQYFTVRYFRVIETEVDGVVTVTETPVTNYMGNEKELDDTWARPYNAGTYRAEVHFAAPNGSNFTDVTVNSTLIINPATYDLPLNIVMRNEQVDEDGKEHILHLQYEDTLPSFITPVYSCNGSETEFPDSAGKYLFHVEFKFSEEMAGNYQPLKSMQAYLTIVTKEITDSDSGISIRFKDGTYWRLLVNQCTDLDRFITDWSVGYDTKMKSLYQIELKDELSNIWILENPAIIRLPLTEEMARAEKLIPVFVTIDEKGRFQITEIDERNYRIELTEDEDDLPRYVDIDVERIGYYGIVTSVEGSSSWRGRLIWLGVTGVLAIPAALLITVSVIGNKKRKRK